MIDAAVLGQLDVVAVAPDVGKALEVGGAVLLAVGVVPEADRHRREGRGADQLALLADAPACRRRRRPRPPCRGRGTGSRRARPAPIGLPSTKQETMSVPPEMEERQHVALDLRVDVVEALGRQRRAGRGDGAQRGEVVRLDAARARPWRRRRCTWPRCRRRSCARRRRSRTGRCRRDGRASRRRAAASPRRRGRDQPVPHHPAAGGEVEQAVARLHVAMQPMLLQVLQQRAAGAVHDALRHAGRAGGIHDVERMVERAAARTRSRRPRCGAMKSAQHAPRCGMPSSVGRRRAYRAPPRRASTLGSCCSDLARRLSRQSKVLPL